MEEYVWTVKKVEVSAIISIQVLMVKLVNITISFYFYINVVWLNYP